jgi:hypothetical protein
MKTMNQVLAALLDDRKDALNKRFVWNDEAIKGILHLNSTLIEAEMSLRDEFLNRKLELDLRLADDDKFLTDYNIEPVINLQILLEDENGELEEPIEGIYYELNTYLSYGEHFFCFFIDAFDKNGNPLNWNGLLGDASTHFKDEFIHYGIHELYDHTPLAWEDILKIRSLWAEIKVEYQREIKFG